MYEEKQRIAIIAPQERKGMKKTTIITIVVIHYISVNFMFCALV